MGKRSQPTLPWGHSSSETLQLGEGSFRGEKTGIFKTRLVTAIRNTLAGTCAGFLAGLLPSRDTPAWMKAN